jgi:SAM-dependent methyltransferase
VNVRATLGSARRAASRHARRSGWLEIPSKAAADVSVKPAPYLGIYERVLAPLRFRKCALLELGVWGGDSLVMWRDGMPRATIVGLDLAPPQIDLGRRVHIVGGDQTDGDLLARVRAEHAPAGFDVIIDDASHLGVTTARSLQQLYRHHLKPGGVYCIEDWGTGYLPTWPDGEELKGMVGTEQLDRSASGDPLVDDGPVHIASHDIGMVGLVKRLIDHVAAGSTLAHLAAEHVDGALDVSAMEVYDGVVVLHKP